MTIKTENWLGEYTATIGTGDVIFGGAIEGFAEFSNVGSSVNVFYTIMDGLDKETGIGFLDGNRLIRSEIHATLVAGVYTKNGSAINLSGDAQIYGTANAKFLVDVYAFMAIAEGNTALINQLQELQINGHPLTSSFNLDASDVGAHPSTWLPTAEQLNVYQKEASDIRYLKTQDAEQVAGLLMRVGGARDSEISQQITNVSTTFIGAAPPQGAPDGKRWYDSESGRTFILYRDSDSVQWVEESPSGTPVIVPSDRPVLCLDFVEKREKMWKGYQPRDGQLLNRVDYPDAWIAIESGLVPVCSDSDWIATPSKRGCYTYGDGSTTFRMPDYNGVSQGSLGAVFVKGSPTGFVYGTLSSDSIHNQSGQTSSLMVASGGCWVSKMLGSLQTNLPLISIAQLASFEQRISALESQP